MRQQNIDSVNERTRKRFAAYMSASRRKNIFPNWLTKYLNNNIVSFIPKLIIQVNLPTLLGLTWQPATVYENKNTTLVSI